ncbi:MAG: hypothetical protein ACYC26_12740 [Phycisphaerales bacterium]
MIFQHSADSQPAEQFATNLLIVGIRELMPNTGFSEHAREIEQLGTGQKFLLESHLPGAMNFFSKNRINEFACRFHTN